MVTEIAPRRYNPDEISNFFCWEHGERTTLGTRRFGADVTAVVCAAPVGREEPQAILREEPVVAPQEIVLTAAGVERPIEEPIQVSSEIACFTPTVSTAKVEPETPIETSHTRSTPPKLVLMGLGVLIGTLFALATTLSKG